MLLKRVPKGEADERDNDQMTPLHWSASYGNAEHIKLLLKAASTVTLIDEQSMWIYTIMYFCENSDLVVLRVLTGEIITVRCQ